ncbi:hypothetical protein Tco_0481583, partial [Tanacetum coccineum]
MDGDDEASWFFYLSIVLGATNHVDVLDQTLRRSGIFDCVVMEKRPCERIEVSRKQALEMYLISCL